MKVSVAAIAAFAPLATGFVVLPASQSTRLTSLSAAVVTGPQGKAAASAEEDLMLTLKIIMDHAARSTTVSKDQYISQMKEIQSLPEETEVVDVSIPYDAPAKLAYESSDKSMPYADFKTKYEADAVADVIAKRQSNAAPAAPAPAAPVTEPLAVSPPAAVVTAEVDAPVEVDVSIPYDAPAKLAYESSDKSMPYADFKTKYEADAVADVIAKRQSNAAPAPAAPAPAAPVTEPPAAVAPVEVDISVPYDAAAKLAYEASDKSMAYADFKVKYEADAVADVVSKRPVDLSIPYDAPARLAFLKSDRTTPYSEFKAKYEANAVAEVTAKHASKSG